MNAEKNSRIPAGIVILAVLTSLQCLAVPYFCITLEELSYITVGYLIFIALGVWCAIRSWAERPAVSVILFILMWLSFAGMIAMCLM